jgi:N-acetylglucosamine-6-phosphate deacetylase
MRLGVEAAVVDGELVPGDVEIAEGAIAAVGLAGGGRGIAAPGFVDLQANGFAGVDFASTDSAGYGRAANAMLETGVTAFQPTFITAPEGDLVAALREVPADPRVVGVHLEGPFLSPARLGAHPADARRDPDRALLGRLLDAGPVSYMTLAPEPSHAAFDRGARTITHLFNAMRPLAHRDPGIAGAALAREDVVVQVIVDGVHLAPETVQLVLRAAAGRVALVTDAIAAAGNGDGRYRLGGVDVTVHDGVARREDGVLAGSLLTMVEAVQNLHELGAPLVQALEAASRVPARVLGRDDLGTLRPGARADVVVLDDRLELSRVLLSGRERVAA